jgi:hypothetical protein
MELRIADLIPCPPELNGFLAVDPVGESDGMLKPLGFPAFGDNGRSAEGPLILFFMLYRPPSELAGRSFLKLLEESLSLDLVRRRLALTPTFFADFGVSGVAGVGNTS